MVSSSVLIFPFLFILPADNAYSKVELCERVAVRFARV
jgi:hypothetical protein